MSLGPLPRIASLSALRTIAGAFVVVAGLSGCSGGFSGMNSANFLSVPAVNSVTMFVASTRRDDRQVGEAITSEGVHHTLVMMSVPPDHKPGVIETPSFGKPNRDKHIVQTGGRVLGSERFKQELATHLSGRIGTNRDVLLYVHGFNTSLDEARGRLTQIVYDARFGGVPVLFTWPSKSTLFGYVSDKDQATASRDALQKLMSDLSQVPGVGRVHVLAHSMGSWLAMEALRENAIAGRPDLNGKLGDVMLAAPDIDLAVFRQQLARLQNTRVSIFVSRADRALSLSSRIAGDRPRVGAMDPNNPRDAAQLQELGVRVYDLSSFSAGIIGHAAYADTPDVIRSIGAQLAEPRKDEAGSVAVIDARGSADAVTQTQTPAKPEGSTGAPLQPMQ